MVKDPKVGSIAKKFGSTEQEHVDALIATIKKLGGKPVSAPKTNFGPTFDKGLMATLEAAADVENLGAAAYLGQAGNIKNKEVLAAALAIHSVEARHAAALNILVGRGFGDGKGGLEGALPDGAFGKPMDMNVRPRRRQAVPGLTDHHDHESENAHGFIATGGARAGHHQGSRHDPGVVPPALDAGRRRRVRRAVGNGRSSPGRWPIRAAATSTSSTTRSRSSTSRPSSTCRPPSR